MCHYFVAEKLQEFKFTTEGKYITLSAGHNYLSPEQSGSLKKPKIKDTNYCRRFSSVGFRQNAATIQLCGELDPIFLGNVGKVFEN